MPASQSTYQKGTRKILRSYAHELIHHCQNERGDLAPEKMKTINKNYAQECPHMRKMEEEAYLEGNMCFRDWEDSLDNKTQYIMSIAENKYLKENKNMSVKITKKFLKEAIEKVLMREQTAAADAGVPATSDREGMTQPGETDAEGYTEAPLATELDFTALENTAEFRALSEEEKGRIKSKLTDQETIDTIASAPSALTRGVLLGAFASMAPDAVDEGGRAARGENEEYFPADRQAGGRLREEDNPEEVDEAKAEKDYDGDGRIESSTQEYLGSRDNAIQASEEEEKAKKEAVDPKIQTPEQDSSLYEERFTPRNNKLFERLVKKWTK